MQIVRSASEERPYPFPMVRVPFAWVAYWILTGLDYAFKRVHSLIWQARHHLGTVMFDRPCPRCKRSLWSGERGCNCLLTRPVSFTMVLPEGAKITYDPRATVEYRPRLRRDLFHYGRLHDFHRQHVVEALLSDDKRAKEMR